MKHDLIKVYTDEDMDIAVAKALRLRGFEATTTLEHGKLANPDEEQLKYATSIGMSILTHNIQKFPKLKIKLWVQSARLNQQRQKGEFMRKHFIKTLTGELPHLCWFNLVD